MVYSIFLLYKAFEICVVTAAPVKLLKMKHSLELLEVNGSFWESNLTCTGMLCLIFVTYFLLDSDRFGSSIVYTEK